MSGEERARAMAKAALAHWGWAEDEPRLVKWRENIVFDVRLRSGQRAALRLHRPGYQGRGAIEAELDWMARLAGQGVPVPPPLRTVSGRLTATAGGRVASMVGWIDGVPIGSAERPLDGGPGAQAALMADLGGLIARLHEATDALGLPEAFDRPRWDAEALLGEQPRWGRFWENPALDEGERRDVLQARAEARLRLDAMAAGDADFGLIHADCLRENVLRTEGGLALIDFDDGGWGFRMYDLGTAVVQSLEEPHLAAIVRGILAGYGARRALPEEAESLLLLFVMLRTFASAGWIVSRAEPADPRQRFYAERAVRMARAWLAERPPWR